MKKMIFAAALVLGAFVAMGSQSAQAGCGGYGYGYGYGYHAPVYRAYRVHTYRYAPVYPVYTAPAYGYGCYGW